MEGSYTHAGSRRGVYYSTPDQPDGGKLVTAVAWCDVRMRFGILMLDTQMFLLRYYVSTSGPV
jgi:hypothetical protein